MTTADGSWVEDLNSTNGVFVRGKRVRRYRLQDGDVVKLGMHELTYYRAEPAPTATVVLQDDDGPRTEDEGADAAETEDRTRLLTRYRSSECVSYSSWLAR